MIARFFLALAVFTSIASAMEQAPKSSVRYTPPPDWQRLGGSGSGVASFFTSDNRASVTIDFATPIAVTAEQWHNQLWGRVFDGKKIKRSPVQGRRGDFLSTWASFDKPDGKEVWFCLYSAVNHGRGEAVFFAAEDEVSFKTNLPTADRLVDGIMFASSVNGASGPESDIAPPTELVVELPLGWTQKVDAKSKVIFMRPPDANVTETSSDVEIVIMPARDFAGTADEWHAAALKFAQRGGRLLEPVQKVTVGGLMVSSTRLVDAKGTEQRQVVYTVRWGTRAQMFVFLAKRDDAFTKDGPVADRAIKQIAIPGAGNIVGSGFQPPRMAPAGVTSRRALMAPPAADFAAGPNTGATEAGDTIPVLEYNDPPNFFHGSIGGKSYAEYQGSDVNFTLCVYPFREFQGNLKATFQQTLLRDWIGVMYREEGVAGAPRFGANTVTGADGVVEADFLDNRQQQHHRILIMTGHWAALVDMIAPTAFAWQKGFSSAVLMLKSMHVGRTAAPPSVANGPGPQGAALAGLFQAMKGKTVSNLVLGPGYLNTQNALHYFLFSADGWVHRCYDFPPGGSAAAAGRFNFDSARRQDPGNTGRFTVRGNQLYIKLGGPNADEITATVSDPNALQLDGANYKRVQ